MSFNKLLPILILIGFVVFGASFLPQIMGSVEAGQDVNLSQTHKDQVNSTRDASIVTMGFSKYIAILLGVVALIIAVMWIAKVR